MLCFNHKTLLTNQADLDAAVEELKKFCEHVVVFDIESDASPLRKYGLMLKNLFQRNPHRSVRYFSDKCAEEIRRIRDIEQIDIVHLDKTELAIYSRALTGLKLVCTNHNVESKLMRSRVKYERGPFRKAFAYLQSRKLRRYEQKVLNSVSGYVTCTEVDHRFFHHELGIRNRHVVVDNGVDLDHYSNSKPSQASRNFLIVGAQNVDSTANFDATHWFMKDCWPRIVSQEPDASLKIVGRNPDRTIQEYSKDPAIEVVGFVDDERQYFSEALALLVPIRVGGGSRLKILVGMAMSTPIVSTTIGAEGIGVENGINIILADDSQSFADAAVELYRDRKMNESIGLNARLAVEHQYGWPVLGSRLQKFYQEVIDSPGKSE